MAHRKTPEKASVSSAPATHPTKPPSGKTSSEEMGAEDESPSEARRSKDKAAPAKKAKR